MILKTFSASRKAIQVTEICLLYQIRSHSTSTDAAMFNDCITMYNYNSQLSRGTRDKTQLDTRNALISQEEVRRGAINIDRAGTRGLKG